jgi:hypothetical protein
MKIRIRNVVAVDVDQTDDYSAVTLRFMTVSNDEAVVVVSHELLRELTAQLLPFTSEDDDPAAIGKERTFKNTIQEFFSKGVTRAA